MYRQVFPGRESVIDPRVHIEHELNALLRSSRGSHFLRVLNRAGLVLHQYPKITLESLGYQNGQLTLQVTANQLSQLETLVHALNQVGLHVQQNQMSNKDKKVSAEIMIK